MEELACVVYSSLVVAAASVVYILEVLEVLYIAHMIFISDWFSVNSVCIRVVATTFSREAPHLPSVAGVLACYL